MENIKKSRIRGLTRFAFSYGYGINRNVKTDVRNQVDMGSGWSDVSRYQYRYDGDRRRTDVVNTGSAFAQNALRLWDYNSRSEVIGQSRYLGVNPESPGGAVIEQNFGYGFDNIGNRLISVTEAGGVNETTRTYASNALNQYTSITNPSVSPAFDEDGNMMYDGVKWYYEWDGERRLVEARTYGVTPSSGDERLTFLYDYIGRRVSKKMENFDGVVWAVQDVRKFLYQDWNLLLELDESTDDALKTYLWGMDLSGTLQGAGGVGGLLGMIDIVKDSSMIVFYDVNGNVTQLYDWAEEEVVAHYEYDPFGSIVNIAGDYAQKNVFRFSTKYLDTETGLYYYGFRYYDSATGRWPNRDPIGESGGLNLYAMIGNRSINTWDYLGLSTIVGTALGIGAANENSSGMFDNIPEEELGYIMDPQSICSGYGNIKNTKCCKNGRKRNDDYISKARPVCEMFMSRYGYGAATCVADCLIGKESACQQKQDCDARGSCRLKAHISCYNSCSFYDDVIESAYREGDLGMPEGGWTLGLFDLIIPSIMDAVK